MEAPTLTARPWILKPWSLNRPMGLLGHRVAWGGLTERNLWPVATGAYSRLHVLAEGWCTKSVRIRLAVIWCHNSKVRRTQHQPKGRSASLSCNDVFKRNSNMKKYTILGPGSYSNYYVLGHACGYDSGNWVLRFAMLANKLSGLSCSACLIYRN